MYYLQPPITYSFVLSGHLQSIGQLSKLQISTAALPFAHPWFALLPSPDPLLTVIRSLASHHPLPYCVPLPRNKTDSCLIDYNIYRPITSLFILRQPSMHVILPDWIHQAIQ
jgi:hypothetical protein